MPTMICGRGGLRKAWWDLVGLSLQQKKWVYKPTYNWDETFYKILATIAGPWLPWLCEK